MVEGVGGGEPRFRFGVIGDVQYADVDDRYNHNWTQRRRHRGALECLKRAVDSWNTEKLDFVVDLGDILDMVCEGDKKKFDKLTREEFRQKARDSVLDVWKLLKQPHILRCVGNHEMYLWNRTELSSISGFYPFYGVFRPPAKH